MDEARDLAVSRPVRAQSLAKQIGYNIEMGVGVSPFLEGAEISH